MRLRAAIQASQGPSKADTGRNVLDERIWWEQAAGQGSRQRDGELYAQDMQSHDEIRGLEERAFNAWPAAHTLAVGGWLLRLSHGYTKRANSVSALAPNAPFDEVKAAAEMLFARYSQRPTFRLTPLAPPEAEHMLQDAGYDVIDPNVVMSASVENAMMPEHARIEGEATPAWLRGFSKATGLDDRCHRLHQIMVSSIVFPVAYVTVLENDEPVAFGRGQCERGMVGLFDIVVLPDRRARGHARAVTQALLSWGYQAGAATAYLQVGAHNTAAKQLYATCGFNPAYRYFYRRLACERLFTK